MLPAPGVFVEATAHMWGENKVIFEMRGVFEKDCFMWAKNPCGQLSAEKAFPRGRRPNDATGFIAR
jgi:hypothetical protein